MTEHIREKLVAANDIDAALERLPAEFRAAVVLRDVAGMDYAEIADTLGVPVGTVRSRIARGRRQLVAALALLPERQRLVFMLSHFDGKSSREVSATTGLNESTVRVHLFRAIRRLRALLGADRTATSSSARRTSHAAR